MSTPDIGVISGTPNTGVENSNVFVREVDPRLYFLLRDRYPIASLILTAGLRQDYRDNPNVPKITGKQLKVEAAKNTTFELFEDQVDLSENGYVTTAAVTAAATSLTVSSTDDDAFRAGDILLLTNAAGQSENTLVASVAANTLNLTNSDGTTRTAGIVMTTSDRFYKVSYAREEDSTSPSIITTKRARTINYTQFFSESYGLTRIKMAVSDYNGDAYQLEKRKAMGRFMKQLEHSFWNGEKTVAASTTNPRQQTGGFKYWADTYSDVEVRDMSGFALTRAELNSFLTAVGKYGSTDKVLVCGSEAFGAINNMGYADVAVDSYEKTASMGQNVKKIYGPMGQVTLAYEPLFDEVSIWQGSMAILDMDYIKFKYLAGNGLNLKFEDREQMLADGSSAKKGTYESVGGWGFSTLKSMGLMQNISA